MNRQKIQSYFYIFPIIAILSIVIALITPTAVYINSVSGVLIEIWDFWMFGYTNYYYYETGYRVFWTSAPFPLLASVILTSIVSITIIHNVERVARKKYQSYNTFLGYGILLICGAILYMILEEIYLAFYDFQFWATFIPGFGIIGCFIGGGFLLASYFLGKNTSKFAKLEGTSISSQDLFKKI